MNLKKLGDINYSHLKVDNDLKNDMVNEPLLQDLQKAGQIADVVLTITTAKSDHDYYVKGSKRKSRHMAQTAVDIAKLDGHGSGGATNSQNGKAEFREKGFKVKDALVSMGYTWNTESGNPKAVLWQTNTGGNHYNHLHVSNKTGESSEVEPQIDIDIEDDTNGSTEKKDQPQGVFDNLSQKEKDKIFSELLAMVHGESKEEVDKIITETIRIKELMK